MSSASAGDAGDLLKHNPNYEMKQLLNNYFLFQQQTLKQKDKSEVKNENRHRHV